MEPSPPADSEGEAPTHNQKSTSFSDVSTQARTALKGAGLWLSQVGLKAKDAAVVAGQRIDKAAINVGNKVDQYSQQLGDAYDQRIAKEAASKAEARRHHRYALESAYDETAREASLTQGSSLVQECLQFTGEVQQEIQYAQVDSPLGRESYGLMMLINTLMPLLEHGMREDWKAIIPFEPIPECTVWARSMPYMTRYATPTAFALLVAAEYGWRDGQPIPLGAGDVEAVNDLILPRRLQAWLFQSLTAGALAQRLTTLLSETQLLIDWYYPWAAFVQTDTMSLLIEELVLIESQEGHINLPIEHLFDHTRDPVTGAVPIADRMKGGLLAAKDLAERAGKAVYTKASEVSLRVNDSVESYRHRPTPEHVYVAPPSDSYGAPPQADTGAASTPISVSPGGGNAEGTDAENLKLHFNDTFGNKGDVAQEKSASAKEGGDVNEHFTLDDSEEGLVQGNGAEGDAASTPAYPPDMFPDGIVSEEVPATAARDADATAAEETTHENQGRVTLNDDPTPF